jgi:hypothetical protein
MCNAIYRYASLAVLDYPFEYSGEMLKLITDSSIFYKSL